MLNRRIIEALATAIASVGLAASCATASPGGGVVPAQEPAARADAQAEKETPAKETKEMPTKETPMMETKDAALDKHSRRTIYEAYLVAWSDVSDAERAAILQRTLSPEIAYLDAMTKGRGHAHLAAHLAGFQQRRAGYRFALTSLLVFQDEGLAGWAMIDVGGKVVVEGYDVLRFDDAGRMLQITGFSNAPKQQAM